MSEGVELWKRLEHHGTDNADLARLVGVSVATVRRWRSTARVATPQKYRAKIEAAIAELAERSRSSDTDRLTSDLRQVIASASVVLERVAALTPDQVLASVIFTLARCGENPRITIAPAYRGRVSRDLATPLHYLVGVDLLRPSGSKGGPLRPTTDVTTAVAEALRSQWRDLGLHLRRGYPPEWSHGVKPAVVLQIPIIERPRSVAATDRIAVTGLGRKLIVLAPVYGYGEMIAALLADALGLGLADLRYEEEPPSSVDLDIKPGRARKRAAREARERLARDLLAQSPRNVAFCVAGGKLLQDLRPHLYAPQKDTTVIGVRYRARWAERGLTVHETPVQDQLDNGDDAVAIARQWSRSQPSVVIEYDDSDVCSPSNAKEADVDLIADSTVITSIQILDLLGVDESIWRAGWLADLRNLGRLDQLRRQGAQRASTVTIESARHVDN